MWVAIIVTGAVVLTNTLQLWWSNARMRELEMFVIILSGVIIGQETNAEIVEYLRSRSDHPAGKKGVRLPRRMDDEGTT